MKRSFAALFEWNHNTHYHKFLLNNLPDAKNSALDVGSGLGLFSYKISKFFKKVVCLEPDQKSIEYSQKRFINLANVSFVNDTFLEHDFKDHKFDFISAIASIHHMDFETALIKMVSLLNPGGKIIILGLYRESSLSDLLISLVAMLPNLILNFLSHSNDCEGCEMIITSPTMSIKDIKKISQKILIRYQFRRHLFWRYSIQYEICS